MFSGVACTKFSFQVVTSPLNRMKFRKSSSFISSKILRRASFVWERERRKQSRSGESEQQTALCLPSPVGGGAYAVCNKRWQTLCAILKILSHILLFPWKCQLCPLKKKISLPLPSVTPTCTEESTCSIFRPCMEPLTSITKTMFLGTTGRP